MNVFLTLVLAVQMLAALGMIGLILIQHGKGADMGAAFGSGSSGSLFGASGSANFLSRTTAVLAAGAPSTGRSSTLPVDGRARSFEKNASASVQVKKTAAHAAVERDRKFALPVAPNRLPDAPLPNDAPMSAPLPCWISTSPIIARAAMICSATIRFNNKFMGPDSVFCSSSETTRRRSGQDAARQMAAKSPAFKDAPPISPPSTSPWLNSWLALSALTLPP